MYIFKKISKTLVYYFLCGEGFCKVKKKEQLMCIVFFSYVPELF